MKIWDHIPKRTLASIRRYVAFGVPTGGFLRAVIDNNLKLAVNTADAENLTALPWIVRFFYNYTPDGCWGYDGAFDKWIDREGIRTTIVRDGEEFWPSDSPVPIRWK